MVTISDIDALLPQTQCGECGYAGCRPYAEAIAEGESLSKCPPGGQAVLRKLCHLMGKNLDPVEEALLVDKTRLPQEAYIIESECIGCTKCIQACPVDAILGSAKKMHTVISDECTGCKLCVPACPVDCIELRPLENYYFDKSKAKLRFNQRKVRLDTMARQRRLDYKGKKSSDLVAAALNRKQS